MKRNEKLLSGAVAAMAVVVVVIIALTHKRFPPGDQPSQSVHSGTIEVSQGPTAPPAGVDAGAKTTPPAQRLDSEISSVEGSQADQKPAAKPDKNAKQGGKVAKAKEPVKDPDARLALALVGDDPRAEEYWVSAINNPGLSAHERKDLIEDLNEDGLSDPKHPGPEDLPLILSRIQLIEELAPYSMDQVNLDAFAEAYKDLTDMLKGKPVQ